MVETTSRMASSSSTTSMFSTSTVGWPPRVILPSSHYKGQHTDKLGPLPIQKTGCSFKGKYSPGFQAFRTSLHPRAWNFFFQAEDGIRDLIVTGVQTCALPI